MGLLIHPRYQYHYRYHNHDHAHYNHHNHDDVHESTSTINDDHVNLELTLILVAALISSLRYLNMPGVVFAIAFLTMIYAQPLGITK
ncbi:hypothetical protein WP50_03840, partial [Lactiplantibacillus plantarum]